jgi:hypothetical protein
MMQREDYFETHAPVIKSTTIQILLSLAAALGMVIELADGKPHISTPHFTNQSMQNNPHTLSSRTTRNTSCFSSKHYVDFHNLVSNGQQRCAPRLKPLDSTALLTMIISILTTAIPVIPSTASAQQHSSSPYTLTISSLPPRLNRQSTQQSTTSTRPSTFAV